MAARQQSSSDLSVTLADLTITEVKVTEKELGRGADATVIEVRWKGGFYAGKQLHDFHVKDSNYVRSFAAECKRWSELDHSKIVKFFGVHFRPDLSIPMLILEKMDTTLWKYLQSRDKKRFPLTSKVYVLRQAGEALAYLHSLSPSLIHCDLSPNNILLNQNTLETKVTDFGMSRAVDTSKLTSKSSVKGTQAFIAPEAQLVPPKYDEKRDVFSYGNVIVTMITHDWPHPGPPTRYNDDDELIACTEFQRRQIHLDKFTAQEKEFFLPIIEKCLHNRPKKRPTSREVMNEIRIKEEAIKVSVSQVDQPVHLTDTPPDSSGHMTDSSSTPPSSSGTSASHVTHPTHSTSSSHVTDPSYREIAVEASKVQQQANTKTDNSPTTVAGVKRLHEPTGSDLYMKPKAAKAFSPMSDSRCRSLNKLLPDLEAKLIVDNIKSHLHIDTGGFLNEVEIIEVFSGHSRVEHVRSLFSVLKTKDNATFGSFCLILSKSGYGHWSKALMEEAGLDHNYKGTPQLEKAEVNAILCTKHRKMFKPTFLRRSFNKCRDVLRSILEHLPSEDFKRFMLNFNDSLKLTKKNARLEQSDMESALNVLTTLSLQEMYTQFDLEVFDVMAECLSEGPSKKFTDVLDNYKDNVLRPFLEKTVSELARDAEVVSTHDDRKKQLSLAFVVPDDATFGTLMKAKRYLEEEMEIHKVSNMRFDFNCITVLFDIACPPGDIEELAKRFLSDKHLHEMKKLNVTDVFLLSHWAVVVADGSICYFDEVNEVARERVFRLVGLLDERSYSEVTIPPDIVPIKEVPMRTGMDMEESKKLTSVPQVDHPIHLPDTPPPDSSGHMTDSSSTSASSSSTPASHVTDPSHSTSSSHVTDPSHSTSSSHVTDSSYRESAVVASKVQQQANTKTDNSSTTVAGVKRLHEPTGPATTTESPGPASQLTLEEFYKTIPSDPELLKVVDKFPLWDNIAINLGVPINHVKAFKAQGMGGVSALSYWRNGKSGKDYPSTWGFLMKVIKQTEGSKPAEDLLKLVHKE